MSMKLEFSRQMFKKYSVQWQTSRSKQTERHDLANNRLSQFCECACHGRHRRNLAVNRRWNTDV